MTRTEMIKILKENNQNKDIKWNVKKNTKKIIEIGNTYDDSITFRIELNYQDSKDIRVTDVNGWKEQVSYLLGGSEWFDDFEDVEEGIKKSLIRIVKFFYYYY